MASAHAANIKPIGQDGPLKLWQIVAVGLCVLVNITDGLDTTAIAYAAPVLLTDLGIEAQMFGIVLSAGAAGMMIGAILVAPMADRVGRRPVILTAISTSTICMFLIAISNSFEALLILRFVTGIAIGSLIPTLSVMVIEFSNERRGNVFLALVHIGFAIGAILGAAVGATFIDAFGWRAIFFSAGAITGSVALACFFFMPESVNFLLTRQPRNALPRVNALLRRFGEPELESLPPRPAAKTRNWHGFLAIIAPLVLRTTLFLWLASFSRYFVSYFLTGWKPQVFALAGFTNQAAIAVGMATSAAATVGVLLMGSFASVVGAPRATAFAFILCAFALLGFGITNNPVLLITLSALSMFSIEAAFTGIVITTSRFYPAEIRSTGVGFTMGIGRIGAIVGPYVGGALIGMNLDRSAYFPVYATACVIGAVAVLFALTTRTVATEPAKADAS